MRENFAPRNLSLRPLPNQWSRGQLRKRPTLRFTPTAWAKLLCLRDAGESEIGGFGVSAADDLLLVEEIELVRQTCTWATVEFDDTAVADFFDAQVDAGLRPEQFGRIWVHTHPGDSPRPSGTDEETFARVFGRADWAVMFILARGGECYARLRYNLGPGAELELAVEIDYGREFEGSDFELWQEEYLAKVYIPPPEPKKPKAEAAQAVQEDPFMDDRWVDDRWRDAWTDDSDFDRYSEEAAYGYIRDF
jgi:proteasome lid subunit RPN8/RPN11